MLFTSLARVSAVAVALTGVVAVQMNIERDRSLSMNVSQVLVHGLHNLTHGMISAPLSMPMKHNLTHGIPTHSEILDTCPFDQFQTAVHKIHNSLQLQGGIADAASRQYLDIASRKKCTFDRARWPRSSKPIIVNIGEGTTATGWLDAVMNGLGFQTKRYLGQDKDGVRGKQIDEYEYISGTPLSSLTWDILQSHPQALFIMTMRNPVHWAESSLNKERAGNSARDHFVDVAAIPCGQYNAKYVTLQEDDPKDAVYKHPDLRLHVAELNYVVNTAWSFCVLNETDRLLAGNVLWYQHADTSFFKKLITFLEDHGMQKPDWAARLETVGSLLSENVSSWLSTRHH